MDETTVEDHIAYLNRRVDKVVDYLARRYEDALDGLEFGDGTDGDETGSDEESTLE